MSPRKVPISPDIEKLIQEACIQLRTRAKPNISDVIREIKASTGVALPYHTVRNRFQGKHIPPKQAHISQQLLSPEAERVLVDWITFLSDTGHPLSKRTIRTKAQALCGKKPSKTWITYFLRRHSEIKLGKPSGLDPKRAQAFNKPTVHKHFDLLLEIIRKYEIPIENVYNMDEKGCQRGGGRKNSNRKYFVHRSRRPKYRARSGNLELITIIECVCADGNCLLPGFVFSGKEFAREWFEVDPGIGVSMSENGWTDDFLCKEWFKNSFIQQATARNTSGKPILLIYDGHGSHDKIELINLAREHNIILFCLPPHTTHKLQPLDVGVFGPFQRAWSERCDEVVEDTGDEMPREDFVKEYMDVRSKTFKSTTIITAFRKSGCWPVNQDVFTDEDYAPSIPTSTSSRHVPGSYPVEFEDLDNESDASDGNPAHGMGNSDDELSDDNDSDNADVAIDNLNSENSQNNTAIASRPLSTAAVSCHPLALPPQAVVPNSATSTVRAPSSTLLALGPIPSRVFYASTTRRKRNSITIPSSNPVQVQLNALSQAYSHLSQQITELHSENSTLKAHCAIAGTEIQDLKRRLNVKENRPQKRRKLNVDARWLNSDEGLRLAEEQEALRIAEEQKKREAREQREAKEAEREEQRRQRDPNAPFTGALTSKTKADLQDIAQILGLTIDGQKKEVLARINSHFDANPVLREDSRFEGIFNRTRRRPAMQTEPEDGTSNSAGPSHLPPSLPPPRTPLSSNIVNIHPFSYTSPHPAGMIPPSFFPPHPPLPYHHPSFNSHFHHNPHSIQN